MSNPLPPTSEPDIIATTAAIKMCLAYCWQQCIDAINAMLGCPNAPGFDYEPENSNLAPESAPPRHDAKPRGNMEVMARGIGAPNREFLYMDHLAAACLLWPQRHNYKGIVNTSSSKSVSSAHLARLLAIALV
jgi:GDP-L-fucose synthase